VFLSSGSGIRRLASLPWLRSGAVRQLRGYYQDAMTSRRPSRRALFPSLGGTSVALAQVRSSAGECAAEAWSWSPGSSGRDGAEETTGSPKFLGNPNCPFAHVQSTPAGPLTPDHYGAAAWPLVCEKQRLPRKVFRRSIAWLSDWLSTLRRTGCPATTQDSLPAAGQALPDGLSTRRVPTKGFKDTSLHLLLLSQAVLGAITSTDCNSCTGERPVAVINVTARDS
jgi:hypothetical protein